MLSVDAALVEQAAAGDKSLTFSDLCKLVASLVKSNNSLLDKIKQVEEENVTLKNTCEGLTERVQKLEFQQTVKNIMIANIPWKKADLKDGEYENDSDTGSNIEVLMKDIGFRGHFRAHRMGPKKANMAKAPLVRVELSSVSDKRAFFRCLASKKNKSRSAITKATVVFDDVPANLRDRYDMFQKIAYDVRHGKSFREKMKTKTIVKFNEVSLLGCPMRETKFKKMDIEVSIDDDGVDKDFYFSQRKFMEKYFPENTLTKEFVADAEDRKKD